MIDPKELRIGNWVFVDSPKMQRDLAKQIDKVVPQSCQRFDPIPLTEEWLSKVGFINNGYQFNLENDNALLAWTKSGLMYFVGEEGQYLTHIKYVHQIQNLWMALTGQELG